MPDPTEQQPKRRRGCWYAAACIVFLLVIGFCYAFHAAWETADRMHCAAQLSHIAMAVQCYAQRYLAFPPAYTTDRNGRKLHSWRTLILPYLCVDAFYDKLRLDEPWDSPYNHEVLENAKDPLFYFHCCSATNRETETSYMMVVGPNTISNGSSFVGLGDIKDGASSTIMLVEVKNSGIHWAEPRDLDFKDMTFRVNDPVSKGISSYHRGLAYIALCNGSICCICDDIDPKLLKALVTINGGEDVNEFFRNK
jgi:hypothetical protein